jgi:hypothetical protein
MASAILQSESRYNVGGISGGNPILAERVPFTSSLPPQVNSALPSGVQWFWMATTPKPSPDSPFGKFQVFMSKLVQVPKAELDRKLMQEQKRKVKKK